jgi:hypothetical protein
MLQKDVAKKLLEKKVTVYTISPVNVEGAVQMETLEEIKNMKIEFSDHVRWRWNNTSSV